MTSCSPSKGGRTLQQYGRYCRFIFSSVHILLTHLQPSLSNWTISPLSQYLLHPSLQDLLQPPHSTQLSREITPCTLEKCVAITPWLGNLREPLQSYRVSISLLSSCASPLRLLCHHNRLAKRSRAHAVVGGWVLEKTVQRSTASTKEEEASSEILQSEIQARSTQLPKLELLLHSLVSVVHHVV